MKIFFRISKLGFGGAEQVFISVAKELQNIMPCTPIFVVDCNKGENISTVENLSFDIISLNSSRTLMSIIPLSKEIDHHKPDIIISAYTDTNAACLISKSLSKHSPPVIVSEHASLHDHWKNKSKLKRLILNFYVSQIYKLSHKVIGVSQGVTNQVNSLLKTNEKTTTIYNPVRFENQEYTKKEKKPFINLLAVGRISIQKNYEMLIRAVFEINKKHPVKLKIVGGIYDHEEYNKLMMLISDLRINKNIEFSGYTDSVEDYYKEADIFTLSSSWEGFGNVIVEAMAFGLPIVSTNCNHGPEEILQNGKYGRLTDVNDYNSFAQAILDEYQSPLIDETSIRSRTKYFSEKNIAINYKDLIMEVVDGK